MAEEPEDEKQPEEPVADEATQEAPADPEKAKAAGEEPEVGREIEADSPEAKFVILVSSIATQVLVSLGQIENPISKKKEKDLKSAKFSIDLLQLLADKTRGNLTGPESKYLEGILYQLRMGYVEASK